MLKVSSPGTSRAASALTTVESIPPLMQAPSGASAYSSRRTEAASLS
jgi:hypothetical protein